MICPKCNVEMVSGKAIQTRADSHARCIIFFQEIINADTLKLVDVYKCSKCGYSDDGIDGKKLISVENHNVAESL